MAQSHFENFVDQENMPAMRRGKAGENNIGLNARSTRPVLGEISQNIASRRNPIRAVKQASIVVGL